MKKVTTVLEKTIIISFYLGLSIWIVQSLIYGDWWNPTGIVKFFAAYSMVLTVILNLIKYS